VEPHLEVLRRTAAAPGTDSSSLSFRWAMEGLVYTEREDGYYYDVEGVRYRHSGEDGQYTYEQVSSRELQTTFVCPLQHWMPWFPRQSTM
jgi:hypothetical protein